MQYLEVIISMDSVQQIEPKQKNEIVPIVMLHESDVVFSYFASCFVRVFYFKFACLFHQSAVIRNLIQDDDCNDFSS